MIRFRSVCVSVAAAVILLRGITAGKPRMIPAEEEILIQEGDELIIRCQGEGEIQFSTEWNLARVNQSEHDISFNNNSGWYTFTRPNATRVDTGWYACAEKGIDILNDEQTIDHPDTDISWIYVYVNSSKPFLLDGSYEYLKTVIPMVKGQSLVIPCRPTSPNLSVILELNDEIEVLENSLYDPKIGFIVPDGELFQDDIVRCGIKDTLSYSPRFSFSKQKIRLNILQGVVSRAVKGHNLTLKCQGFAPAAGRRLYPSWEIPKSVSKTKVNYDTVIVPEGSTYKWFNWDEVITTLTIRNVERNDAGQYSCTVKYLSNEAPEIEKILVWVAEPGVIRFHTVKAEEFLGDSARIMCRPEGYPLTNFTWLKIGDAGNEKLPSRITSSSELDNGYYESTMYLHFENITREDNGVYECRAIDYSGTVISNRVNFVVLEVPEVNINSAKPGASKPAESEWVTTLDEDPEFVTNVSMIRVSNTSITIEWSVEPAKHRDLVHYYSVQIIRENDIWESTYPAAKLNTRSFEDLNTGEKYWIRVAACSNYTQRCGNYSSRLETVVMDKDPKFVPNILHVESTLNSLKMSWSTPPAELQEGVRQYKVLAKSSKGDKGPFNVKKTKNSYVFENLVPETGYGLQVAACSEYETQCGNWSSVKETLTIEVEKGEGGGGQVTIWIVVSIVTILLFSTMFIWMRIRKRSELAARRRFIQATIERFKIGDRDSLDPELEMAAQAELRLTTKNKVIGSGAFGTVKKAVATSICKGEKYTTVAVKMVRANHRLDHMMALQRELKILAHLGKHVNVVNLLGACTGNISYGELFVIVEFCRFGNLRDFLLRRRADFVDQVDVANEIVAGPSSRTDCVIAINSGMGTAYVDGNSASKECSRSPDSNDGSEVQIADDPTPENDSVEPVQMSNYEGDFTDSDVDPIGTWDLLCWAWQISRGMKYLSSKRVVHGDLAARNILLAERNVVKICDFGLAKTLYAGDIYKKSGTGPLPVKWMAVESIRDRLFSVKSDVWSFGVVLWELFALGETPYPGIANDSIYQKLIDGFRMERPKYATKYIHNLMRRCWDADPAERPSFGELEDLIDELLDERVKEGYLHFDAMYAKINEETLANGNEDVLAMSPAEYASRTTTI